MTGGFLDTISSLFFDIACVIILSGFLYSFIKYSNKSYASFMIITLTLSYFGYPAINIYTFLFIHTEEASHTQGAIAVAVSIFNLYWTAAFALFTYRVSYSIIEAKAFSFKTFIWSITFTCLFATLLFPLMVFLDVWGNKIHFVIHGSHNIGSYVEDESSAKIPFILVRDIIGRLVPTLATSICYFKLYYLLRDSMNIVSFSRPALLRLFWYSTIPLVCAIPGILNDMNNDWAEIYSSPILTAIIRYLRYFWEFLNLWAYWKLNPLSSSKRTDSSSFLSADL